MGELEKTIQLETYGWSFSIFSSFLFVFMIFYRLFIPNLEGEGVLAIIILGGAIIQLTASIIIKKKYS